MRLLVDAGLPIDWTEGAVVDKIGVDDFGMNTGALTDCAGRVGVASVDVGDCGGTLLVEGGVRDGKFRISRWVYLRRRGGGLETLRYSCRVGYGRTYKGSTGSCCQSRSW